VEVTTRQTPPNATHWSTHRLARQLGVSQSRVSRVWRANGLKPHSSRTFKVSHDPRFAEKRTDGVGLYLDPPEHALVLSCEEQSRIQALDRTPKGLPLKKGRCGTMTHDYQRHGTTTPFAALRLLDGRVIRRCDSRHRHQERLKFLRRIEAETPPELDLHLMVDHDATHKHPRVQSWLKNPPRFHGHFTPTSSSWLNLVERRFRDLTDQRIRRGTFASVAKLQAAIRAYIDVHHQNPKAFKWTAKADVILEKVRRARAVLNKMQTA